jgi:hypothetical protein
MYGHGKLDIDAWRDWYQVKFVDEPLLTVDDN